MMVRLNDSVINSVREGLFNIYAVNHVEEAMAILTGKPSGVRNKDGEFPKNSVNYHVQHHLQDLSKLADKKNSRKVGK